MALPISYNIRNVFVRWRATIATILGVASLVAVFVVVQAMATGLEKTSANTGDPRNLMIVRKGSPAESSSQVKLEQFKLIQYMPGIAKDAKGHPIVSADVIILINLPRRENQGEANVSVRGVSPTGMELRPQVKLVEGRWFTPGKREVVVSRRLAKRFANFEIGGKFKTGGKELSVVGITEAGNSAFDSEIWMDADESRAIFDRENYSSVLVRVESLEAGNTLTNRIENDNRLTLRAVTESEYYASQTKTAAPIKFIGYFLAIAMSIGATIAAMNTMYATVGSRTREIGTLRVLGFRRRSILLSFMIEGAFLALIGGGLGCLLSLLFQGYTFGMMNFQTFSETVFQFRITPGLAVKGLIFSFIVGVIGSFLPAIRAARLPVIAALKSV